MTADLLRPPATLTAPEALRRSQQAPDILELSSWTLPWPLSILTTTDAPEKWSIYENLFYSCLRTGDNRSADLCLERIKERFGDTNERVMGLMGLYHEATATNQGALESYLDQYKAAIKEKPTNMIVRKRYVALLRTLGKIPEAITALRELLDISPTDAEAWSEVSDLYLLQGLYPQAIYSLEEVLLVTPFAWNMHARLGEVLYIAASASSGDGIRGLVRSMKCFCRSIELCDDYLRGFYGLKIVTTKLIGILQTSGTELAKVANADTDFKLPSLKTVESLNELATKKLSEIVRRSSSSESGWQGYSEAELIASRALLDQDVSNITKQQY